MPENPNWEVRTKGGWRKENAPDVQSKNRQNWLQRKIDIVNATNEAIADLRRRQNARNEEYRRRRGHG